MVEAHGVGTLRVGNEQPGGNAAHGDQPLGIAGLQVEWTGPDVLLIFGQMLQEARLVRMRDGTIDRDRGSLRRQCASSGRSCWLLRVQRKAGAGNPESQSEHKLGQRVRQKGPLESATGPRRSKSNASN